MDVDTIQVNAMTPEECANCMKEGHCFFCKDKGHMSKACPKKKNETKASQT
jgi:Zinc knuckle